MAEKTAIDATTNADEVTTEMQQLSLDVEAEPADQNDSQNGSQDVSEPEAAGSATIGADEAKDSESLPPESKTQPVKGRVFVGGISWRTTDRDLRVGLSGGMEFCISGRLRCDLKFCICVRVCVCVCVCREWHKSSVFRKIRRSKIVLHADLCELK